MKLEKVSKTMIAVMLVSAIGITSTGCTTKIQETNNLTKNNNQIESNDPKVKEGDTKIFAPGEHVFRITADYSQHSYPVYKGYEIMEIQQQIYNAGYDDNCIQMFVYYKNTVEVTATATPSESSDLKGCEYQTPGTPTQPTQQKTLTLNNN